jgi:hypothetical protein
MSRMGNAVGFFQASLQLWYSSNMQTAAGKNVLLVRLVVPGDLKGPGPLQRATARAPTVGPVQSLPTTATVPKKVLNLEAALP